MEFKAKLSPPKQSVEFEDQIWFEITKKFAKKCLALSKQAKSFIVKINLDLQNKYITIIKFINWPKHRWMLTYSFKLFLRNNSYNSFAYAGTQVGGLVVSKWRYTKL